MAAAKDSLTLGYWGIRGLAEPIRMLLRYQLGQSGAGWTDKVYTGMDEWFGKDKHSLSLDFPNLPYLLDGDVKISQSGAILKYLGRKYGLVPDSCQEHVCDMLHSQLTDIRMNLARVSYNPDFDNLIEAAKEKFVVNLAEIEKWLNGKQFMMGDKVTYVDFIGYEAFEAWKLLSPKLLEGSCNVNNYLDRIRGLKNIKDFLNDKDKNTHLSYCFNSPMATWPGLPGDAKKQEKLVLGYWALRGMGEPCRMLLRYALGEADHCDPQGRWTDKMYTLEQMQEWFGNETCEGDKKTMCKEGLNFPNLPYLVDPSRNVKISQSLAIMRYLGGKFNLAPTMMEKHTADSLEQHLQDLRTNMSKLCYSKQEVFDEEKPKALETFKTKLAMIESFLAEGKWMLGDRLTYIDFLAYEFLNNWHAFTPDHYKEAPKVVNYMERFKEIPQLKAWFNGPNNTHKTYCVNAPFATWNGKPPQASSES